ncbi:hypothetical protein [Phenylobacterium sp.]|uniref:hypothetical protein n=1 Tax=Phenylobacterium sp. TaxID=1871053 RepID=UPI002F4162D5
MILITPVFVALAPLAIPVPAQAQYSHDAQAVIARARAASGGTAWNTLRGWHETGTDGAAAYERWIDPLRYGMRVEMHEGAGGGPPVVRGFNGAGEWGISPAGQQTGTGDAGRLATARTEDFYGVYGFLYASRFDAHGRLVGEKRAGGRNFDVVLVEPWRAAARELWFDRSTGLLGRMIERDGARTLTVELSDYRKVGPLKVAFRFVSSDGPEGAARVRQIRTLDFAPADRAMFSLPAQP